MKFVILLLSSLLLTACGGGASVGGSGSGGEPLSPVAAATTFALKQAYTNEFMDTKPYTFAVSGNVIITNDNPPSSISGAISGTGSINPSTVSATSFDGVAAQLKTKTPSGTITITVANVASAPQALPIVPATQYVSGAFDLLGFTTPATVVSGVSVPASFSAAAAAFAIPPTASVGDVGTAGVINAYATSAKGQVLGTTTITYAVEADTSSTAIMRLTQTSRNPSGVITSTQSDTYRITPLGNITRLKQETRTTLSVNGTTTDLSLVFTY